MTVVMVTMKAMMTFVQVVAVVGVVVMVVVAASMDLATMVERNEIHRILADSHHACNRDSSGLTSQTSQTSHKLAQIMMKQQQSISINT